MSHHLSVSSPHPSPLSTRPRAYRVKLMLAPMTLDVSFSLFSATILLTEKLLLFSSLHHCAWLRLLIGSYLPLITLVDSN